MARLIRWIEPTEDAEARFEVFDSEDPDTVLGTGDTAEAAAEDADKRHGKEVIE